MKIEHNTQKWEVKTNRHPTTGGHGWGWIEGAPGNVCWSNEEKFNRAEAAKIVAEHNEWLEKQTPIDIRLMKIRAMRDKKVKELQDHNKKGDKILSDIRSIDCDIEALEKEKAPSAPEV